MRIDFRGVMIRSSSQKIPEYPHDCVMNHLPQSSMNILTIASCSIILNSAWIFCRLCYTDSPHPLFAIRLCIRGIIGILYNILQLWTPNSTNGNLFTQCRGIMKLRNVRGQMNKRVVTEGEVSYSCARGRVTNLHFVAVPCSRSPFGLLVCELLRLPGLRAATQTVRQPCIHSLAPFQPSFPESGSAVRFLVLA